MPVVDQLVALLQYKVEGEQHVRQFKKNMDGLGTSATRAATQIKVFAAAAAAAFAASGLGSFIRGITEVSAQFETFGATLETIEGSAEKAKKSLDWIRSFAQQTPYEVEGITKAFVKLKALGFDPLDGTMKTLGDTASAMGISLDQAVNAFTDATTGEFERLKELGITTKTAGDQVTFTWVKNGETLTKTIKKNQGEISNFLRQHFERNFGGAMQKRMTTWTGMISNLADAWTDFRKRIGESGFFDVIKGKLKAVLDQLQRWEKDGTLKWAAQMISDVLVKGVKALAYVFERLVVHARALSKALGGEGWAKFADFMKSYVTIGAMANPLLWLEDIATYLEGGQSLFGDFMKKFPAIEKALKDMFSGLTGTGLFGDPLKDIREILALLESLGTKVGEWGDQWNALKAKWAADFVSLGKSIVDWLIEGLTGFGDRFTTWLTDMFKGALAAAIKALRGMLPGIADTVPGGISYDGDGYGGARVQRASIGGDGGMTTGGAAASHGTSGGSGAAVAANVSGNQAAFLKTISGPGIEGADYNTIVGGGKFSDFSQHPGIVGLRTAAGPSTAAGRYQFTKTTWGRVAKILGLKDFSPASQDKAALWLASTDYKRRTGRDFNSDLDAAMSGDDKAAESLRRGLGGHGYDTTWQGLQRIGSSKWATRLRGNKGASVAASAANGGAGDTSAAYKQFRGNYEMMNRGGATINNSPSHSQSVSVQAPFSVNVARADQAPAATARAVGNAVNRGARLASKPGRMQASAAA